MKPRRKLAAAVTVLLLAACGACLGRRKDAATPEQMKARIAELEQELPALRQKLGELLEKRRHPHVF